MTGLTPASVVQLCWTHVKAKENLRDFFTGDDLAKVQNMEMLVSSLINCGWGYQQIKEFVQSEATKMIA